MRPWSPACALVAVICLPSIAQTEQADPVTHPRAYMELLANSSIRLSVSTPGWRDGGDIPFAYTQYRDNQFPGLRWSAGPDGTKTYAIIMQDIDNPRGEPFLHWMLYDIPARVRNLPLGMHPGDKPAGSNYGPNYEGSAQPYLGPKTPPGPKHHYYLQVFALDTSIPADPSITFDTLIRQMKGHVLASGETMGLGRADTSTR